MISLSAPDIAALRQEAQILRKTVLNMAFRAGSGHCGGSFSCAEILTVLYRTVLRVRPEEPTWAERDRFILSKGHAAPMLYAVLARCGFFPEVQLNTLRTFGSPLQGHPDMRKVPGVEMSSGSLGMGISNGIGLAWAARLHGESWHTYVLTGDGELNEGQNWEAAMLAAKLQLSNLTVIVDLNRVQLDGATEQVMPLGDLAAKFTAFGWRVQECGGHDPKGLLASLHNAAQLPGPHAILAYTVKGKGVPFMEGNHQWHGAPLLEKDYTTALAALEGGC